MYRASEKYKDSYCVCSSVLIKPLPDKMRVRSTVKANLFMMILFMGFTPYPD